MANYYTYTQPIRYYKANDPYYYEVDNIPLRQLEENILYIKELIEGTGGNPGKSITGGVPLNSLSELDITNIKQLRPKSGGGRNVTVNSGLFNSRINDAYNISKPLTELTFAGTPRTATTVIPELQQVWTETQRNNVWTSFVGAATSETSYNVNGLEISYTFYNTPGSMGRAWGVTTSRSQSGEGTENYPKYAGVSPSVEHRWPGYSNFGDLAGQFLAGGSPPSVSYTFENLPDINMAFVKMWRGVFRTAVVDFPESTIEIPEWSNDDFYYYDSMGTKVIIDADQRIDLLVAYSVPIDSSGAALQDYQSGFGNTGSETKPKIVTQPVLGLFKGAGVGIRQGNVTNPKVVLTNEGLTDPGTPGSARMVANASDNEALSNQGITLQDGTQAKIHGSFPSPDDLLNIAPVLALGSANTDLQLVGQAALPLAYIVVNKGAGNLLTDSDIIDIRPFLRTAELTYNERAGVAAANPPLSFANPAIGAFQLQSVVTALENTGGGFVSQSQDGKAIYTDYVMGGLAYGVEGTMLTMCDSPQGARDPFGSQTQTALYIDPPTNAMYTFAEFTSSKAFLDYTASLSKKEAFLQYIYNMRQGDLKQWLSDPNLSFSQNPLTYLGLPAGTTGRNIPLYPEWDMPMNGTNYTSLMGSQPGVAVPKVTWWMYFEGTKRNERSLAFVPGGVISTETGPRSNHLNAIFGFGTGTDEAGSFINQCSKKLQVNLPSWVEDYDVLVEYVNCNPLTAATGSSPNKATVGMGGGLSINKGPIVAANAGKSAVFQITSSSDNLTLDMINSGGEIIDPHPMPDYQFLSYAVALPQFVANNWGTGPQNEVATANQRLVPKLGAAYYPTIKFTIIGYTSSTVGRNAAYTFLNGNYTLLQNVSDGDASNLLSQIGPLMVNNSGQQAGSVIDIRNS